jgi:hypothetical protein
MRSKLERLEHNLRIRWTIFMVTAALVIVPVFTEIVDNRVREEPLIPVPMVSISQVDMEKANVLYVTGNKVDGESN